MNYKEKRALAKSLFVKSSLNRKEICERVGVAPKTLRSWIEKGNWETIKDSHTITRSQLLQDAYQQLKAINRKIAEELDGVPNKELSDAKGVIRKEIETLSDNPLYLYIEVVDEFTNWLEKNHPAQLKTTTELTFQFIESKVQDSV